MADPQLPISDTDELIQDHAGALDALRIVVAAIVKSHPDKAALLAALREIQTRAQGEVSVLQPKRQATLDAVYAELTSHAQQQTRSGPK